VHSYTCDQSCATPPPPPPSPSEYEPPQVSVGPDSIVAVGTEYIDLTASVTQGSDTIANTTWVIVRGEGLALRSATDLNTRVTGLDTEQIAEFRIEVVDVMGVMAVASSTHQVVAVAPPTPAPAPPDSAVVVGYYSNWAQYRLAQEGKWRFFPENIDATKLTHICYAFAKVSPQFEIQPTEWNDVVDWDPSQGMYRRFHAHVRSQNPAIKTLISIGGYNFNSLAATKTIFSDMAGSATNRGTFIKSCMHFARLHGFDGVDVDWEYPGHAGQGGRPEDKANFVLLLTEFRTAIEDEARAGGKPALLLTIAVGVGPTVVQNGYDLAAIHPSLDFMMLMTYDLWGSWERTTGAHTALDTDPQQSLSVTSALDSFLVSVPKGKVVLGLAAYGRSFTLADAANAGMYAPAVGGGAPGPVTAERGFLAYYETLLLDNASKRINVPTRTCFTSQGSLWVGYDDVATINLKVDLILSRGVLGAMIWSLDLDNFLDGYPLTSAVSTKIMGVITTGVVCQVANCSDHGACSSITGQCQCQVGFFGPQCEQAIAPVASPSVLLTKDGANLVSGDNAVRFPSGAKVDVNVTGFFFTLASKVKEDVSVVAAKVQGGVLLRLEPAVRCMRINPSCHLPHHTAPSMCLLCACVCSVVRL